MPNHVVNHLQMCSSWVCILSEIRALRAQNSAHLCLAWRNLIEAEETEQSNILDSVLLNFDEGHFTCLNCPHIHFFLLWHSRPDLDFVLGSWHGIAWEKLVTFLFTQRALYIHSENVPIHSTVKGTLSWKGKFVGLYFSELFWKHYCNAVDAIADADKGRITMIQKNFWLRKKQIYMNCIIAKLTVSP